MSYKKSISFLDSLTTACSLLIDVISETHNIIQENNLHKKQIPLSILVPDNKQEFLSKVDLINPKEEEIRLKIMHNKNPIIDMHQKQKLMPIVNGSTPEEYFIQWCKSLGGENWPIFVAIISFTSFLPFLWIFLSNHSDYSSLPLGEAVLSILLGNLNPSQDNDLVYRMTSSLALPFIIVLNCFYFATIMSSHVRFQIRFRVLSRCIWILMIISVTLILVKLRH